MISNGKNQIHAPNDGLQWRMRNHFCNKEKGISPAKDAQCEIQPQGNIRQSDLELFSKRLTIFKGVKPLKTNGKNLTNYSRLKEIKEAWQPSTNKTWSWILVLVLWKILLKQSVLEQEHILDVKNSIKMYFWI